MSGDRADPCHTIRPLASSSSTPTSPTRPRSTRRRGILKQGGLVAFATETVYGLGAIATDPAGRRADLRGQGTARDQPADRPRRGYRAGPRLRRATGPTTAERLAARFWPGPLTLVLNRSAIIPDVVTAGKDTVARACSRRQGRSRPDRTDGPADRGPEREPVEPALADPGRARAGRSRRRDRPDHRQRADRRRPGVNGPRPDRRALPRLLRPGPISTSELEAALGGLPRHRTDRRRIASIGLRAPGRCRSTMRPGPRRSASIRLEELAGIAHRENMAVVVIGEQPIGPRRRCRPLRFALETPEAASRLLYDVLHQCDSLERGLDRRASCRPTSPSGRPFATGLLRATRPLAERRADRARPSGQSNSRRWESNDGEHPARAEGAGSPRWR